jgi:hypothetical protein
VKPGETVVLGGISRTLEDESAGSRVITASRQSRDERVLLLTIDIE